MDIQHESCDWLLLLKDSSFTSAKGDPPARIKANLRTLQMTLSRQLWLFSFFPWDTLWAGECFTHHNAKEGIPLPFDCTFFRPAPSSYLHQFPATFTFKLRFFRWPHTLQNSVLSQKSRGTNLAARTTLYILCFSYSLTHGWRQHPELDGPFVSSVTAGPIPWALCITCFLPPLQKSNPHKHYWIHNKGYGNTSL